MAHIPHITGDEYLQYCKRRFGNANPERIENPVWEWMIRTGGNPYAARDMLGLPQSYDDGCPMPGNPDWCFDRMGRARIKMPDGRVITIAGEHEDFYDPDFCIYNDVIVQRGDDIEIYGYPRSLFPPTDFHTATLVGNKIYIIGSLGYQEERKDNAMPVFVLDTETYRIEAVPTTGDSPGRINSHHAVLLDDGLSIEVTGGEVWYVDGAEDRHRNNFDIFRLDVMTGVWTQVTDTSDWRQLTLEYDEELNDTFTLRPPSLGWYTGEVLRDLGYPCTLYEEPEEDEAEDENEESSEDRVHMLYIQETPVRIVDTYDCIHITIQGSLPQQAIDTLIERLTTALTATGRTVTRLREF